MSSLLSDLKNVMATSDVVRYRVYEVGIQSALAFCQLLDVKRQRNF